MDPPPPFTLMQQKYECLRYRPCMNRALRLARWRPRAEWSDESSEEKESRENENDAGNGKTKAQQPDQRSKRFKPDHNGTKDSKRETIIDAHCSLEDVEEDEPMKKVSTWLASQDPSHAPPAPATVTVNTEELPNAEKQAKLVELDKQARELEKFKSLLAYADDRPKLIQEAFASINDRILFHLVPDLLKDEMSLAQLRQRCVEQLDKWPLERIQHILSGMTLSAVCRLEDVECQKPILHAAVESETHQKPINGMPTTFPDDLFNDAEQILFQLLQLAEESERKNHQSNLEWTSKKNDDLFNDANDVADQLSVYHSKPDNCSKEQPVIQTENFSKRDGNLSPVSTESVLDHEIKVLQLKQEILLGILSSKQRKKKNKLLFVDAKKDGEEKPAQSTSDVSLEKPDAEKAAVDCNDHATSPISDTNNLYEFFQQSSSAVHAAPPAVIKQSFGSKSRCDDAKCSPHSPVSSSSSSSFDFEQVYSRRRRLSSQRNAEQDRAVSSFEMCKKLASAAVPIDDGSLNRNATEFVDYFSEERYRADATKMLSSRRSTRSKNSRALMKHAACESEEGEVSD